jgi:flagellar motor switch protein FliN/FliY
VTVNDEPMTPVPGEQSLVESAPAASRSLPTDSHLDLLLDVQLEATIRFGERQLLLRDILSMGPGSLIELDRRLEEPADLLVAGRLIARGEVVVVNGNFGLRITELASAAPQPTPAP